MPESLVKSQRNLEGDVRAALATDSRTAACADLAMTVQPGGLSNHAWTVLVRGQRWFVRLSPPDPARLGVDRESECALLHVVAAAGLAPPVVRCDPGRRLLVTQFIDGAPLQRDAATSPHNIERLADTLRRLHALPVPPQVGVVDFEAQARRLEHACMAATVQHRDLREGADRALQLLERSAGTRALCHNDLHHLNLVDAGSRLWLVDWEYGGAGDPVYDLASFLCQHDCDPHARRRFVAAYGEDAAIEPERLDAACLVFDYVQWLWYRACLDEAPPASSVYEARAAALEQRLLAARS